MYFIVVMPSQPIENKLFKKNGNGSDSIQIQFPYEWIYDAKDPNDIKTQLKQLEKESLKKSPIFIELKKNFFTKGNKTLILNKSIIKKVFYHTPKTLQKMMSSKLSSEDINSAINTFLRMCKEDFFETIKDGKLISKDLPNHISKIKRIFENENLSLLERFEKGCKIAKNAYKENETIYSLWKRSPLTNHIYKILGLYITENKDPSFIKEQLEILSVLSPNDSMYSPTAH